MDTSSAPINPSRPGRAAGTRGHGRTTLRSFIRLLHRVGVHLEPYYLFVESSAGDPGDAWSGTEAEFAGHTVEFLKPRDMAELAAMENRELPEPEEVLRARLDKGEKCLGMRWNGSIVAFSWCALRHCDSIFYRCKLSEREAYLRDAYTVPAFRGRRLAPYLRHRMHRELEREGRDRFYSISTWRNEAALNFKRKLGARPILLGVRVYTGRNWHRALCVRLRIYECPEFFRNRLRLFNLAGPRA